MPTNRPRTSAKNEPGEFDRFTDFMRRLVAVPHSEIKAKLDAEKLTKEQKRTSKVRVFQSLHPIPKPHCPVCKMDIDVSQASYGEPLSICHGTVTVNTVPGTLVCTLDFCTS